MPAGNFWLVRTGAGASEVQNLPAGQRPLQAGWGNAVYLGPTPSSSKNIAAAARRLGVPNPQNVPSLATSVGIIGSIVGGFGAGAIAAGGEAAAAGVAGTEAASAGEAVAAGETAATRAGSSVGSKATSLGSKALLYGSLASMITSPLDFLKMLAWMFHPHNILRAVEGAIGLLLIFTGIYTMSRTLRSATGSAGRAIASVTPLGASGRVVRKVRLPHAESESG
jgi:hypothetical protein